MKSVYTGSEKVAEFESYDELRVGDGKPAFIYEGNELVYPNPVKDGLVLWYDFSGRTNADGQRGIAEDLSGNGNHGTLQNFNYTAESGYDKNKLLFDGVDDRILGSNSTTEWVDTGKLSLEIVFSKKAADNNGTLAGCSFENFEIRTFGSGSLIFYYSNGLSSNFREFQMSVDYSKTIHLVAIFHKDEDKVEIYINDVKEREWVNAAKADMTGLSENSNYIVGARKTSTHLNGEVYSNKVYNRPLTPEEIAHNYAIEKERFGIE